MGPAPDGGVPTGLPAEVVLAAGGPQDADEVAAVAAAVRGGDVQVWRDRMRRVLPREECLALARAVPGGELVGYGKAGLCAPAGADDPAPAGHYLTGLVVLPAWRRRGVGQELTRWRRDWAWARDRSAWCFTNAGNLASQRLHARLGFVEAGRAAAYLGVGFDGGEGVLLRADRPAGA